MTDNLPAAEVLEARAAEQRRQLHNSVTELRSTLKEKLNVKKTARQHLASAAGFAAVVGLALGYSLAAVFTD